MKMGRGKMVIEGPMIRIVEPLGRFEIVKKVVSHFIDFEKDKKGKGIEFRYPVENLSNGEKLYIHRPGIKWNFDFKVEIPSDSNLGEGRHDQIALILRDMKNSNSEDFERIWNIISNLYHCKNNDVDSMLKGERIHNIKDIPLDVLLKVIKWLFIMEDIVYWHYEGRAFLYNFFKYVVFEMNDENLKNILEKVRRRKIKPEGIRKMLNDINSNWEEP